MIQQPPKQKFRRELFTGDNLDIMRGMDTDSVDMIYLDPPFNSGKQWAAPIGSGRKKIASFNDVWTLNDVRMSEHALLERDSPKLHAIIGALYAVNGGSWKAYLTYMGMRLLEMRRILKPEGCIFYHCDPVMSHGVKLVMDAVFGKGNFRNEIIWRKTNSPKAQSRALGAQHDVIFSYAKSGKSVYNKVYTEADAGYLKNFRHKDERGLYQTVALSNKTGSGGFAHMREYKWRGVEARWIYSKKQLNEWWAQGRIVKTARGNYRKKHYLHESGGKLVSDIWADDEVAPIQGKSKERTGYPTQKPRSFLERIIKMASAEGDMVLDPFCGCATTCVAAERLKRQWIGIDISEVAAEIVMERLDSETEFMGQKHVRHRTDIPLRSDSPPPSKDIKERLYGKQGGFCNGCGVHFFIDNMAKDHIIPRAAGGRDTDANLQLLCGYCNSVKGDRDMAYLFAQLKKRGRTAAQN